MASLLRLACLCLCLAPGTAAAAAPNILFVLADDLGVDAVGAYGATDARTPNIDRLAGEGTRFTRHYVDSSCAATRVGLLIGAPPARSGFRPAGLGISPETQTYADALRDRGYHTLHVGKWHAGFASRLAWPRQQGFDHFYGFLNQFLLRAPGDATAWRLLRPTNRDPWLQRDNAPPRLQVGWLTDHLVDEAVARILEAPGDRPWLLNLWTLAPHTPHSAPAALLARYPATPRGRYLAMVELLDRALGRLLAALEEAGVAVNTLVLLAGDNGTDARFLPDEPPLAGSKGSLRDGGVRTPLIVRWPGRVAAGVRDDRVVAYTDYLATLVAAAGGEAPGFDFLGTPSQRPAPLTWEYGAGDARVWSVLSPDGRWRLLREPGRDPELGPVDHQDPAPEGLAGLLQDVRDRAAREAASVPYRFLPRGSDGAGILTGVALNRAPGFGGRTAALCLVPRDVATRQVIVDQSPLWSVHLEHGRVTAQVSGLRATAMLPPGQPVALVIDSLFDHALAFPKASRARLRLFVGSRLVDEVSTTKPGLPLDVYHRPTYLGTDSRGSMRFQGRMGRPLLFNDDLASMAAGEDLSLAAARLAERACAGLAAAGA